MDLIFDRYFDEAMFDTPQNAADLAASSEIAETMSAVYAMGSFDFALGSIDVSGNAGTRVVHTEQSSEGHANADGTTPAIPIDIDRNYTDILPSLNLRATLAENLYLRLAYDRQISRPSPELLAPGLTITIQSGAGRGGNPNLDPYRSNNFDASLEWYFDRVGKVSVAGFVKDFDSYLTQTVTQLVIPNTFGQDFYNITSQANGGEARLAGLEFAYQQTFDFLPGPWSGLGVEAAYTRVSQEATFNVANGSAGTQVVKDAIVGVSPNSFSVIGFYEQDRISARLGYTWRDEYLVAIGATGQTNAYFRSFGSLDGSLSYEITDRLVLTAEAINLAGSTLSVATRTMDGQDLTGQVYDHGRTFALGLTARF